VAGGACCVSQQRTQAMTLRRDATTTLSASSVKVNFTADLSNITMSLHRVSDEGVGEWVFSYKWKSIPADSGTVTDFFHSFFDNT
jgi:hypothetical protein